MMDALTREEIFLEGIANGEEPNLEPQTRREALLKRIAAAGGVTSWNNLKDKPFYEETETKTLVEEQTVPPDGSGAYSFTTINGIIGDLFLGDECIVTYNGVAYDVVVEEGTDDWDSTVLVLRGFGKYIWYADGDTYQSSNFGSGWACRTAETFTLKVEKVATTIHTLDKKFLPKSAAVADAAGETPTAEEFNALLAALRDAGYLEA